MLRKTSYHQQRANPNISSQLNRKLTVQYIQTKALLMDAYNKISNKRLDCWGVSFSFTLKEKIAMIGKNNYAYSCINLSMVGGDS